MINRFWVQGFVVIAATCWVRPPQTAAGAILITHGDTVTYLGEVAAQFKAQARQIANGNVKIGFKYSYWGIFWLDFWTWGGEYCLYNEQGHMPLSRAQAAVLLGMSEDELGKPWFYKFPPGLLIVGGLVAIGVTVGVLQRQSQRRKRALFDDPRYRRALEIVAEHAAKEPASPSPEGPQPNRAGLEAALQYLVNEGIPPAQAEKNLVTMMRLLSQMPAGQPKAPDNALPEPPVGQEMVGQTVTVRLEKAGDQPDQVVGRLPDGSLVVVEDAAGLIGEEVAVGVTQVLQTPEGRVLVGKPIGRASD